MKPVIPLALALAALLSQAAAAGQPAPLVIGHRGASGYLPEHTIEGYTLAIEQGADFIEPDLVSTKDGVLIARHENEIGGTTDVAAKFPERKARKVIDGKEIEGWFTEDLTLAEIKTLRAKERTDFRSHDNDGKFLVPTFDEVIALAKARSAATGRTIGIYPELKHGSYFDQVGLSLEEKLVAALKAAGWTGKDAPVFVQSFEVANLKELNGVIDVRLVQLIDDAKKAPADFVAAGDKRTYADLLTAAGLKEIATYADGVGPYKRNIVAENPDKTLQPANTVITDAHAAGLVVHPWTFRNEDGRYLSPDYKGDPIAEYHQFFALGVDGVFSDFPDTAVKARASFKP
ncbi:glycerophosphodiester phosphodiesterase [Oleomonas cavernae]|uniref:glycerophosphodiester phosphodiesterase n=1 Tax=Oleomonas cavernae TaxID=2320859 RepID=A0A418VUA4_9PROT|nr:glycerophosphodiester phosphodiesterase [Oleomonas cavernae]RJF80729.1 glycerophosphodiester phosphodiesterase [Oleomonas cavernae]